MNEVVKTFLLEGDKLMSHMHLGQAGFSYSACGPFFKNKERIQKFTETGDGRYIYKNELYKILYQLLLTFFQDNDIEIHLTHNEGKSVAAEIFKRTL